MESTSPSPRMKFAVRSGTGVRLLALSRRLWKNTLGRKKCINQKLIGERSHEPWASGCHRRSTRSKGVGFECAGPEGGFLFHGFLSDLHRHFYPPHAGHL